MALHLSPAYDLTDSNTMYHQHAAAVLGAGEPTMDDVLAFDLEDHGPHAVHYLTDGSHHHG